jgi:hypothetical protein
MSRLELSTTFVDFFLVLALIPVIFRCARHLAQVRRPRD